MVLYLNSCHVLEKDQRKYLFTTMIMCNKTEQWCVCTRANNAVVCVCEKTCMYLSKRKKVCVTAHPGVHLLASWLRPWSTIVGVCVQGVPMRTFPV